MQSSLSFLVDDMIGMNWKVFMALLSKKSTIRKEAMGKVSNNNSAHKNLMSRGDNCHDFTCSIALCGK